MNSVLLTIPQIPEPLTVWEKLEIYTSDDDSKGVYLSRIEDFIGDELIISAPEFIHGNSLLRNNTEVLVLVTKKDAVYQFVTTIKKHTDENDTRYLLTTPKFPRRIQRREFVRINYSVPVEYSVFNNNYIKENIKWYQSLTHDLSGSGMLIETISDVSEDIFLLIKSDIFKKLGIGQPILGRCCRSEFIDNGHFSAINFILSEDIKMYSDNVPFERVSGLADNFTFSVQEQLVSFVFQHQIEMRKKGIM